MPQMTVEEAVEWGKTLNFEKVWAMFAETDRKMAESRAETERFLKESRAETERRMAESRAETDRFLKESRAETERKIAEADRFLKESRAETERKMAETDRFLKESRAETERKIAEADRSFKESRAETERIIAELGKNVGGLNRSLGELIETLMAARLWEKFPEYGFIRPYRRVPIFNEAGRPITEIDILLSNADKAMAVEVKRELDDADDVKRHLERMELIRTYPPAEVVNKCLFGAMAGGLVASDVARYAYEAGFYVLELTGETVGLIPPPDGFKPGTW
jgi:hypothetical protein